MRGSSRARALLERPRAGNVSGGIVAFGDGFAPRRSSGRARPRHRGSCCKTQTVLIDAGLRLRRLTSVKATHKNGRWYLEPARGACLWDLRKCRECRQAEYAILRGVVSQACLIPRDPWMLGIAVAGYISAHHNFGTKFCPKLRARRGHLAAKRVLWVCLSANIGPIGMFRQNGASTQYLRLPKKRSGLTAHPDSDLGEVQFANVVSTGFGEVWSTQNSWSQGGLEATTNSAFPWLVSPRALAWGSMGPVSIGRRDRLACPSPRHLRRPQQAMHSE